LKFGLASDRGCNSRRAIAWGPEAPPRRGAAAADCTKYDFGGRIHSRFAADQFFPWLGPWFATKLGALARVRVGPSCCVAQNRTVEARLTTARPHKYPPTHPPPKPPINLFLGSGSQQDTFSRTTKCPDSALWDQAPRQWDLAPSGPNRGLALPSWS